MNIIFEKILERDIDFLIIENFIKNKNFRNIFLSKLRLETYNILSIEHSYKDNYGENDITIIMSNGLEKVALLIEDKIDAIAMPNQNNRYYIRGNKGVENHLYDRFFVFVVAPLSYLETNLEAKKYDNKISYETLLETLKDDLYYSSIINKAIEEKKNGYVVIENEKVTRFWVKYYQFIKLNYPRLYINEIETPRGENAGWPHLKTPLKNVYIIHKSDKGFVDLTFKGLGNKYGLFKNLVQAYLDEDMTIHQTSKSIAVRLHIPIIDFKSDFNDCENEIKISLDSAMRLLNLLDRLDADKIFNI